MQLTIDTVIGFTYLPVRFISSMGVVLSLLSFLYAGFLTLRWSIFGSAIEGWTSLAILVVAVGGLTLFSLGIIAEYLWRILDEVRKRPSVVVDSIKSDRGG